MGKKNILINLKVLGEYINKIGFTRTMYYYGQRLFLNKKNIKASIRGLQYPIFLRPGSYDTNIFHQIFVREELGFNYAGPIKTIIDCGANIGLSSLYYLRQYPDAHIYAFEPEEENFKMLELNTRHYKNITLFKMGIFNKKCILTIIDIGEGEASYQLRENPENFKVIGHINCVSLNDVLQELPEKRMDIVKMDIEGSEMECLRPANLEWLQSTGNFLVEFHDYINPGHSEEIKLKLSPQMKISIKGEYTFFQNNTDNK